MHVIVIGAGIIGVTTAFELRTRGFEVTVLERNAGVAQEASFGNAGVISTAYAGPWAQPGMPSKVLSYLGRAYAPVYFRPTFDPAQWRWLVRWLGQCRAQRFQVNKLRMQRLADYSRRVLHELRNRHAIDYEQAQGWLQLFRNDADLTRAQPSIDILKQAKVAHRLLTAAECRLQEPALAEGTPLAGGLYLPDEEIGNCAYFARRIKEIAQADGVVFRFGVTATRLAVAGGRVDEIQSSAGPVRADAVVLAAGADSSLLLGGTGLQVPLYPIKGYSLSVPIGRHEFAPTISLMDEAYKVAITRMGNRLRIAGTAELGSRRLELRDAALGTLLKVVRDWFPGAANYSKAQPWVGARPMLPDGAPLLGATPLANLYLNLGHGSTGWAMACGSARVVADLLAGRAPDIDLDGLSLRRYDTDLP